MQKRLILTILVALALVILTGCNLSDMSPITEVGCDRPVTAYVSSDNYFRAFDVKEYTRISGGWMVIVAKTGEVIKTNEKNVILVQENEP